MDHLIKLFCIYLKKIFYDIFYDIRILYKNKKYPDYIEIIKYLVVVLFLKILFLKIYHLEASHHFSK